MRKIKSTIALILSAIMIVSMLAGCGSGKAETANSPEPSATPEAAPEVSETPDVILEEVPMTDPPAEIMAKPDNRTGVLSLLNLSEEERKQIADLRTLVDQELARQGYWSGKFPKSGTQEVVYYDTLNTMLMALNAGQVDSMDVYQSVAKYICAENPNLSANSYTWDRSQSAFIKSVLKSVLTDDFSFLLKEGSETLRDEMNSAIRLMKMDGTLDTLIEKYITNFNSNPEAVEMPKFDGAQSIKVAVTGDLPPLDYVSADGKPAGFNTAVLAEIGKRLGKNIELVVIDSGARATALASGNADVVFWALTSEYAKRIKDHSGEDLYVYMSAYTPEERAVVDKMKNLVTFDYTAIDIPESTIITEPYFSDFTVSVMKGERVEQIVEERKEIVKTVETLPKVTANPYSQAVYEGSSLYVSSSYENAKWAEWHFISPDGTKDIRFDNAEAYFGYGLRVLNGDQKTMNLIHIPLTMNGWRVYCRYSNDAGSVNTGSALITVYLNYAVQPTPTPKPTATPTPTPTPSAKPAPATPTPTAKPEPKQPEPVMPEEGLYVYSKRGDTVMIYQTSAGWIDRDGVYYIEEDEYTFMNVITGVLYADSPSFWFSPEYYDRFVDDELLLVDEEGNWVLIYHDSEGWMDFDGCTYVQYTDELFLNTTTQVYFAGSPDYWMDDDDSYEDPEPWFGPVDPPVIDPVDDPVVTPDPDQYDEPEWEPYPEPEYEPEYEPEFVPEYAPEPYVEPDPYVEPEPDVEPEQDMDMEPEFQDHSEAPLEIDSEPETME